MTIDQVMEVRMETVSLADAKARLSELVERALNGQPVQITRRGKPVVQISAIERPRKPIDVEALRKLTGSMPEHPEPEEGFMRWMRDQERY